MAIATGTALALGAGAALTTGVLNYAANKSAQERAEMLHNESLQRWLSINIPNPKDQEIALRKFVQEGTLDPKLEQAIKASPSEFSKITANPDHAAAQERALSELSKIGYEGGLRLQDKAALQDARMDSIAREKANRMGVSDEMARRGLSGSGYDVAARLSGQSGVADRESQAGLQVAANAQERALQAIMGAGNMASQFRNQSFNEQAQKAAAADKINLFNTQAMQDVQARNIAAQNRATEMNLAERQRIADQNTKQYNYQQEYNRGLQQQQYDNILKRMAGATGQYSNLANNAVQQGQTLGNLYSNMGQGISSAAASLGQYGLLKDHLSKNNESNVSSLGQYDLLDDYLKKNKNLA